MIRYKSPLRYPGGKVKLTNFIKRVIKDNDLVGCHYVEPYAGGAGLALSLLVDGFVDQIHINDIENTLYSFWLSVLEETDAFCELIKDTPITIEQWNIQKEIFDNPIGATRLQLGFATFYVNRTNRSGILNGGVIGGKDQSGKWKLDARFNKENLIKRIRIIAKYREYISVYRMDAVEFISNVFPLIDDNVLVYLDPPYFVKGSKLYKNHYQEKDHKKLAKIVSSDIKNCWIVSYDNVSEITGLYKDYNSIEYKISYSAQEKYEGKEIMFFSDDLTIPNIKEPIKAEKVSLNRELFEEVN